MRKKLMLRLCLMMIALLSSHSCRQDILSEQETYNNSSAFQLTSKRISLSESKHKAKLTFELNKAKDEFKSFAKKNVQGKTVNFGDSISVNTDDVIYMENGPNYHTYTFNIQRNSPLPNAPVENLVLTPLPDGTYKAYLVTYNLTDAEKAQIVNGGDVSVNNKGTVTPLEGNFSSALARTECLMYLVDYYTICNGNLKHKNGETEAQGCTASVKSQHVVILDVNCSGGLSPQPGIEGPVDGGTDGSGGTAPNPCSVNGTYVNPQDPATSGCNAGVVTQPNLEFNPPKTPCQKIQEIGKDSRVKDLFEGLKTKTNSTKEFGELIRNVDGEIKHTPLEGEPGTGTIEFEIPTGIKIDAYFHSHYTGLHSVFSPWDLAALGQWYKNGHVKDIDTFVTGVVTGSGTQYMIVIDDPAKFDTFANSFVKNGMIDEPLTEVWGVLNYRAYNIKEINKGGIPATNELGLVKLLADSNSGLKVLKGSNNSNNWAELTIENGQIKPKPCN